MKRKFALAVSVVAALLIGGTVLILTSQPTQAAVSVDASARAASASTLLLSDDFDYGTTAGNLTAVSAGNWISHSGTSGFVGYTTTSLSMVGYGSSGVGGAATVATTGVEDVNRTFITQTTGTVYFAALVNVSAAGTGDYFLHLKNATTFGFPARVFAKNDLGVLRFGLSSTSAAAIYSTTAAFTYNTTYLMVTKYNVGTGATALYVLDAFSASEPATPLVSFITGTLETVQAIAIRQGSAGARPAATIDGVRVANTWADVVGAPSEADLGVAKSGPGTVSAGDTITYSISLSNTGNTTATTTILTDSFPSEVSFVTYTTAIPVTFTQTSPTQLVWELGDVAAATTTLSIQVQGVVSPSIANGTRFTNTVTASTAYTETNLGNNTAKVGTLVGSPDLVVVKNGPANVNAGDTLTFTLTYSNAGDLPATGVMLVDQLPTAMAYVTDSVPAAVAANGVVTWSIGSLNPDQSGSIVLTATALYAGQYQNRVTLTGVPLDSDLANNTSIVTTTIAGANPYMQKSGPAVLIGGDVVSYTMTYGNKGNLPTGVVTVTDNLPTGFSVSDIVGDNSGLNIVANSGSIRVWTTTIAAGSSSVFTLALTVPNSVTIASGTLVTNTVQVTSLDLGNDPSDDVATATGTVYQIVPIATARAGSNGQVFAVEGNVTVIPATYSAGEWELQDASGGITAFYTPAPTLALGDRVRLVGVFDNSYGAQPELASPRYFAKLGPGSPVNPIQHHTGDVLAGATPGWLVTISGTLSGLSTCSSNYHLSVNDGSGAADVFINAYSNPAINPCGRGFANGDWVQITGFSTIYSPTYEVRPRMASDLVQYPRVLKVGPASGATNVALSANITATFNTTMTNVDTSTFLVQSPSGPVAGTVLYAAASKTATFTPNTNLAANTKYTATLKSNLQAYNSMSFYPAQDVVWTFTTHQTVPNLSTSTLASPGQVVYGGSFVTYTFTLINTGDMNATTTVTDVLPSYYAVGNALDFTQPTMGTLTWTGVVTAGQTVNVHFVARVTQVGQLPIGLNLLFNSATVNDGLHPVFTLDDPTPPMITIYGIYLPLIKR